MTSAGRSIEGTEPAWVVVLEAATALDSRCLHRLLEALSDVHAGAVHCPDRYALQMEIDAGGQAEALIVAFARCRSALADLGQPVGEFVRCEVLSREEFQRDCRLAAGGPANPAAALATTLRLLQLLSN
jgi:hypothetical protein